MLAAGQAAARGGASTAEAPLRWLLEIKRHATARGTPEETTKTNLKLEYRPEGVVPLLRLELPFPDADTDFEGSPLDPEFGDAQRTDINQTRLEIEARANWPTGRFAKATFRPVVDWVGDGQTGAVLEVEGGRPAGRQWLLSVMGGFRLWGAGVPSTYSKRLEPKAAYRF
jgi:hypothetical protein